MTALLLPGTLCDQALWSGVLLPADATQSGPLRGSSLGRAAERAVARAPGPVHLVGFSLGAIVAFEVLRRFPERVAQLTLISATPHPASPAQLDTWAEQERQVRAGRFEEVAATLAPAGPLRGRVLEMALRVGPDTFLDQLGLLRSRPDSRETLQTYTGPLTLLVGEQDAVTPPRLAEEMKVLAPQATLNVIPNAGHYLPLDRPQTVLDALHGHVYA